MRQQTILGRRYVLGDPLARGGVGQVYVAYDLHSGRQVAVKCLRPEHTSDPDSLARFEQEARITLQLDHENIARIYDFGRDGERHYLVLELLGPTLKDLIERRGRLPIGTAVDIARQVLAGLGAAHAAGVVHRDVKPQNVLFADDPGELRVKVVDFGIARILSSPSTTSVGSFLGTPYYVSPEQARGGAGSPRSDLYSVGVLLYEMLTGTVPFGQGGDEDVLKQHLETPPLPPRELRPGIPPRLEAIVLRALEKQPDRRWPDADSMSTALASYDAPELSPSADETRPLTASGDTIIRPSLPFAGDSNGQTNGNGSWKLGRLRGLANSTVLPRDGAPASATLATPMPEGAVRPAKRVGRLGLVALLVVGTLVALLLGAGAIRARGVGSSPSPTATPRASTTTPGVALEASAFDGGCFADTIPARLAGATVILGQESTCPRAVAQLELAERPRGAVALRLDALTSPLEAPEVAVVVNDRQMFRGRLDLPGAGGRGEVSLTVPDGTLRAGRNRIEVRNLAADAQPELGPWIVLFGAEVIRG